MEREGWHSFSTINFMTLRQLRQRYEFLTPQPFDGRREGAIALLISIVWFLAIVVRLSLPEAGDWTQAEKLYEAGSFIVFAAIPIFGLATRVGEKFAKQILLPNHGLGFQGLMCLLLLAYMGLGRSLPLNPKHFPWIEQLNHLVVPSHFNLNLVLFLGGLFIALRIPFLALRLRAEPFWLMGKPWIPQLQQHRELIALLVLNTLYLCAVHTSFLFPHPVGDSSEGLIVGVVCGLVCIGLNGLGVARRGDHPFNKLRGHLQLSDFWLMVLCAAIIYWVSTPSLTFGVFIAVDLFILVLVYGTGLGREQFGYSFQMRPYDWRVLAQTLAIALLILVPLALLSGFVQPQRAEASLPKLLSYFVLFTLRVGVFEEVFFRSGIMVLLRDQFLSRGRDRFSPQQITWFSALGCSVLFGLVHIGNEAGASTLAPWLYKGLYILLATTASMFYAIAFARSNRLAPAILIHGFIDTTAVVLLGGFLAVPF
jgi:membrane protease YdiL (CAAX protease family)